MLGLSGSSWFGALSGTLFGATSPGWYLQTRTGTWTGSAVPVVLLTLSATFLSTLLSPDDAGLCERLFEIWYMAKRA